MTSRRYSGDDETVIAALPLICMGAAAFVGLPGIGLYAGLLIASVYVRSVTTPKEGRRMMRHTVPGERFFAQLAEYVGHPFKAVVGTGSNASWWPPMRLSWMWNALASGVLASMPSVLVASGVSLPHFLHALSSPGFELLSCVGYFWSAQAITAASRGETPPVLVEWASIKALGSASAPSVIVAVFVGVVVFFALAHAHQIVDVVTKTQGGTLGSSAYAGLGAKGAVVVSATAGLLAGGVLFSIAYVEHYLKPHRDAKENHMMWAGRWQAVLPATVYPPQFSKEVKLPEESPDVAIATFQVPVGMRMDQYLSVGKQLASLMGTDFADIHPAFTQGDGNKPNPSGTSHSVFHLSYPLVHVGPDAHLNRTFGDKSQLFSSIISYEFRKVFAELKLGQPVFVTYKVLTSEDSPGRIVETMWHLDIGVSYDAVAKARYQLQEKLHAPWLVVGRRSTASPTAGGQVPLQYVSILYGDPPSRARYAEGGRISASQHRRFVEQVEWDARFRDCGLVAAGAGPMLIGRVVDDNAKVIDWTFTYPPGLQAADIEVSMEKLRAVAGAPGWILFRRDEDATRFHLLTADVDPLERIYRFMEWAPQILHQPIPGQARLKWVAGVGVHHELVTFEFDTDAPHLLVAGETGQGKSICLSSMILQLAVSNTPDDLQFRLIDPKTELAIYGDLAHVSHLVEVTAHGDMHVRFLEVLMHTLLEAKHRYALLTSVKEKKLSDAKAKGLLGDIPYILVVMDEVAMLLNPPDKKLATAITGCITQLANMGRAAGIFLVMATQYPSNASVPNHLREQFSRIGFKVQDLAASRLVLEVSGLEKISRPGVGMMRSKGEVTRFRGFFLDAGGIDVPPDHDIILSHLPRKVAGSVIDDAGAFHAPEPVPAPPPGVWGN